MGTAKCHRVPSQTYNLAVAGTQYKCYKKLMELRKQPELLDNADISVSIQDLLIKEDSEQKSNFNSITHTIVFRI